MKQILRLTTTLIVLLFLGGSAWGQTTYTHEITSQTWTAYDTEILSGIDWTAAATGGAYWGYLAAKGQQFGSKNSPATALSLSTSSFPGTITSVKVSTSGAASIVSTVSVSVGGSAFSPASYSLTDANVEYSFTGSGSGEVLITWTPTTPKALYLKKLEVTYSVGPPPPTITVNPISLSGFTYVIGSGPSAEQTFTVAGSNLDVDISIAAPADYEISETSGSGYTSPITLTQASGVVSSTTIYVRLKAGLSAGDYNDEVITASSAGATAQTVTCSGDVTAPPAPDAPLATDATSVGVNGFTANWNAVSGATGYNLDVYSSTGGALTLEEGFDGGTTEPEGWTFTGVGTYTTAASSGIAIPSLKFDSSGDNVLTPILASAATSLSFWIKGQTTDAISALLVEGFDGTDWVMMENIVPLPTTGTTITYNSSSTPALPSDLIQFRFTYTKSAGNLAFDDVSISYGGAVSFVSGYENLDVGNVTSYAVTDLDAATTYYYVVRATNANGTSANSNEIMVTTTGGNQNPVITNIVQTPATGITSSTTVSVSADVTDSDGTVEGVELHWGTTSGSLGTTISMTNTSGDTFKTVTDIPAQSNGVTVYYVVYALDNDADDATSPEQSYTVTDPVIEPTNHPSGFEAEASSSRTIIVIWKDAVPAAAGYLIKGSATSYEDIVDPADGTPENDALLVQNIPTGDEIHEFTGLSASTQYFFKIYPYNGSGAEINYKTDGNVPQAEATTDDAPPAPKVFFSEYLEGSSNNKALEIYNGEATSIDLSDFTVNLYSNGGLIPKYTWTGTTTLASGQTFIIYNAGADPAIIAKGDVSNTVTYFNGDDAIELVYDGISIDVIGIIGERPVPAWDVAGTTNATLDYTLVRKLSVTSGNTDWASSSGTDANNSEWIVFDIDHFYNLGVFGAGWSGAESNDWNAAGNWDVQIPSATVNALINESATYYPTIAAAETCNSLIIENGATLLGGENLTISGSTFFKKAITGYSAIGAPDGWYAIAPPVAGPIASSNFAPIADEDDFYVYDQTTNYWLNYHDTSNPPELFDNFDPGTGYLVAYAIANAGIKNAKGTLNAAASYSPTLSNSNTGWNLIGNPYPSKVTWADVTNTTVSSPKVMNPTNGAWEDMGSELDVAQGIFVYAEDGTSSLTFKTADQTHGSNGLKSAVAQLTVEARFADNLAVKLLLQTNQEASTNYEWQHDARYFYPVTTIPYLCATTDDEVWVSKYVFSPNGQTTIIPVRFTVQESQNITFAVDGFVKEAGITSLTLEDAFANKFTELSAGETYSFIADPSDDPMRFKLHAVTTTGIIDGSSEGMNIYANGSSLYLSSEKALDAQVEMYNVTGQKVFAKNVLMDGLTQVNANLTIGWYIVKVSTQEGIATQKVFIQAN